MVEITIKQSNKKTNKQKPKQETNSRKKTKIFKQGMQEMMGTACILPQAFALPLEPGLLALTCRLQFL